MPLAALDLIELIQAALPLILGVGWVVLQVVSAMQGNGNKPKRPPQPRRVPDAGGEPDKQADLRSEVDEFLRRLKNPNADPDEPAPRPAADRADLADKQRREQRAATQQRRPRRPRVEVLVDDQGSPPAPEAPRRLVPAAERPKPPIKPPSPSRPKPAPPDQAKRLREQAARAEAASAEPGVHDKFDQQLGSLAAQSSEAAEHAYDEPAYDSPDGEGNQPPAAAQQIAAMLRDPDNVRNAVILNEILSRRV